MADVWEYRIVYGNLNKDQLNQHGKSGWELVTVTHAAEYIFKRKVAPVILRARTKRSDES